MTTAERDRIFEENMGLIDKVLSTVQCRLSFTGMYDREDLYQLGCLGLLRAIDTYDPDKGVQFSTYAWVIIKNKILKAVEKEYRHHGKEISGDDDSIIIPEAVYTDPPVSEVNEILDILQKVSAISPKQIQNGIEAIILISQGYSEPEIAELFGMTVTAVRIAVCRARKVLKGCNDLLSLTDIAIADAKSNQFTIQMNSLIEKYI